MAVKIGHATLDENSKIRGGKAGDQSSKEVLIQDWYKRDWSVVFRAKDSAVAEKIAKAMEQACINNNIGYDQAQRTSLYEQAKKLNWRISDINEACECDCSSLVAVCVNAAGIRVSKDMYTGNQKTLLSNTGKFDLLDGDAYLSKPNYLKRGDILLSPGHTAIVISGNSRQLIDSAKSFSSEFIGTYSVSASNLNIRCGAGTSKSILTAIPKGTKVRCYGYYTKTLDTNWLYVQFTNKSNSYTGFASAKYLIK